jgi:protein gp37
MSRGRQVARASPGDRQAEFPEVDEGAEFHGTCGGVQGVGGVMGTTGIQWTDAVWNPTTGCTRVSPGCKNCYAFALHDMRHEAFKAGKKVPAQYAKPFKELQLLPDRLDTPLGWKKPRRVFVNSMSDLFHEDVPFEFIEKVHETIRECERHTFQILTKRPQRMLDYWTWRQEEYFGRSKISRPPPNAWYGVSVEDQKRADERIPLLLRAPAAVRFLSCEPLLEAVDLDLERYESPGWFEYRNRLIDWAIVGGESGPGSRRLNVEWIRSLVNQCAAAGVACFVKQLGTGYSLHTDLGRGFHHADGEERFIVKDRHGGDPDEWPEDLRVREFPEVRGP